jgi:hypothetical protein
MTGYWFRNSLLLWQLEVHLTLTTGSELYRKWSSESSGMYCRVLKWMSTDVSEVRAVCYRPDDEAARTSETSADIQLRTCQYISEDSELHTRRRENLKSHVYNNLLLLWEAKGNLLPTEILPEDRVLLSNRKFTSLWLQKLRLTTEPKFHHSFPFRIPTWNIGPLSGFLWSHIRLDTR